MKDEDVEECIGREVSTRNNAEKWSDDSVGYFRLDTNFSSRYGCVGIDDVAKSFNEVKKSQSQILIEDIWRLEDEGKKKNKDFYYLP